MLHLFNSLLKKILSRELVLILRLSKFLFVIIIFAHFSACAWYAIGNWCHKNPEECGGTSWLDETPYFEFDSSTLFESYSISWYWSVVTLMTTGYGDIVATNVYEQWVASICILIGTVFFAYFIGAVGGLLVDGDRVRAQLQEKVDQAHQFCLFKKLPSDLSHAIITHTKYHCKNNFMFDEMSILNNLPRHLKSDVSIYVGTQILNQLKLFDKLDYQTIGLISLKMKLISCNAGYTLFDENDLGNEIYIQRSGRSLLSKRKRKRKTKKDSRDVEFECLLKRGSVCGEDSLLYKTKEYSLTCQTWSEFYVLDCDDIWKILQKQYPYTFVNKFKRMRDIVLNLRSMKNNTNNHRQKFRPLKVDLNSRLSKIKKQHPRTPQDSEFNAKAVSQAVEWEDVPKDDFHAFFDAYKPSIMNLNMKNPSQARNSSSNTYATIGKQVNFGPMFATVAETAATKENNKSGYSTLKEHSVTASGISTNINNVVVEMEDIENASVDGDGDDDDGNDGEDRRSRLKVRTKSMPHLNLGDDMDDDDENASDESTGNDLKRKSRSKSLRGPAARQSKSKSKSRSRSRNRNRHRSGKSTDSISDWKAQSEQAQARSASTINNFQHVGSGSILRPHSIRKRGLPFATIQDTVAGDIVNDGNNANNVNNINNGYGTMNDIDTRTYSNGKNKNKRKKKNKNKGSYKSKSEENNVKSKVKTVYEEPSSKAKRKAKKEDEIDNSESDDDDGSDSNSNSESESETIDSDDIKFDDDDIEDENEDIFEDRSRGSSKFGFLQRKNSFERDSKISRNFAKREREREKSTIQMEKLQKQKEEWLTMKTNKQNEVKKKTTENEKSETRFKSISITKSMANTKIKEKYKQASTKLGIGLSKTSKTSKKSKKSKKASKITTTSNTKSDISDNVQEKESRKEREILGDEKGSDEAKTNGENVYDNDDDKQSTADTQGVVNDRDNDDDNDIDKEAKNVDTVETNENNMRVFVD